MTAVPHLKLLYMPDMLNFLLVLVCTTDTGSVVTIQNANMGKIFPNSKYGQILG